MKKKDNKFSSILLAVMMIASLFSMVPVTASADEMKTVYVGIISYWHSSEGEELTGWQVHYWGSASCEADADLTRMKGFFAKQSVGDSYWSGAEQTFYMYKATVPADATGYKVHNGNTWVGDDGNLSSCNAAYIFDYGGSNHVLYYSYTEDGYFLVGSMNGWSVGNENYRFTPNTNNEGEYVLYNVSLTTDDQFKVVGVKDNNKTWYPDNSDNYGQNGEITKDGTYNIYFRPDGQGGNDWYYNYFYVEKITDIAVNDAGTEYTIYTAKGWDYFCDMLADNDKGYFTGKTVKLGANIAVSRMAGSAYHDFTGTFDGGGNTLTFEYSATEAYAAPFRYVEGPSATVHAAIQNLNVKSTVSGTNCRHLSGLIGLSGSNVDVSNCNVEVHITSNKGTDDNQMYPSGLMSQCTGPVTINGCTVTGEIATNGKYAAGILGIVQGSATIAKITDCVSSVTINSSTADDGTHGGFVAVSYPGSTTIEGCLFNGKLLTVGTTDTKNCGGFVGWRTTGTVTISNSLYAPAALANGETEVVAGTDDYPSATFGRNVAASNITNCYYTRALGTVQGTKAIAVNKGYTENVNPDYATSGIKLHEGYMECNGIWYAPAGTSLTVGYVDEHGVAQSHAATVLGGSTNTGNDGNDFNGGWYVVGSDISYSATVWFDYDAQLILADGGKMNVTVNQNDGLGFSSTLTIYGQTAGTGELHVSNSSTNSAISGDHLIVNGGIITATRVGTGYAIFINERGNMTINKGDVTSYNDINLYTDASLTMNGGSLSAPYIEDQGGSYVKFNVEFHGGTFKVSTVKVSRLKLDYTSPDDRFEAKIKLKNEFPDPNDSSYRDEAPVIVEEGKAFTDGTHQYFDILTQEKINAINKLEPYINIGDVNGDGLVTIADASMLVELFRFENDVNVFSNADVNGDGQVTPSDIMAILNMILTP